MDSNELSKRHHYVPEWYQRKFLPNGQGEFFVLDKKPIRKLRCTDGRVRNVEPRVVFRRGPIALFREDELYSVALSGVREDVFERFVFGPIDNKGARSNEMFGLWPFSPRHIHQSDISNLVERFGHPSHRMADLIEYLDAQILRTPRGISQLKTVLAKAGYLGPSKNLLINLMDRNRQYNCTIWAECFWEIFEAEEGDLGFLLSDDPVVLFNMDCYPGSRPCTFPNAPNPFWRGTRLLHPLSPKRILVLSHVEHVDSPIRTKARKERRNSRSYDQVMLNYTDIDCHRKLSREDVYAINYIIKSRANRFVASSKEADLFPEKFKANVRWADLDKIFHQPYPTAKSETETIVSYEDGTIEYNNAFGERDVVPSWFVKMNERRDSAHKKED